MKKPTKPKTSTKDLKVPVVKLRFVITEGAPISISAFVKGLEALGIGIERK